MGRIVNQPPAAAAGDQEPTSISHFSHQHPLQLLSVDQRLVNACCTGCKLSLSNSSSSSPRGRGRGRPPGSIAYGCIPCNFFLHISCSKMPHHITHPSHPHVLSLLPKPVYPQGFFCCDACGKQGDGFSYCCGTCNLDIHSGCASLPLTIHPTHHHRHQLHLAFSSPYPNATFSCDVCGQIGSKQWLYRCNSCGYDVHLSCAMSKPKAPPQPPTTIPQHPPLPSSYTVNNNQYYYNQQQQPVVAAPRPPPPPPLPSMQVHHQYYNNNNYVNTNRMQPPRGYQMNPSLNGRVGVGLGAGLGLGLGLGRPAANANAIMSQQSANFVMNALLKSQNMFSGNSAGGSNLLGGGDGSTSTVGGGSGGDDGGVSSDMIGGNDGSASFGGDGDLGSADYGDFGGFDSFGDFSF